MIDSASYLWESGIVSIYSQRLRLKSRNVALYGLMGDVHRDTDILRMHFQFLVVARLATSVIVAPTSRDTSALHFSVGEGSDVTSRADSHLQEPAAALLAKRVVRLLGEVETVQGPSECCPPAPSVRQAQEVFLCLWVYPRGCATIHSTWLSLSVQGSSPNRSWNSCRPLLRVYISFFKIEFIGVVVVNKATQLSGI